MSNSFEKFAIAFLALPICLSGCKNKSAIVEENAHSSKSEIESSALLYSSDNIVQSEPIHIGSNEAQENLSETAFKKSAQLNGKILGIIDSGNGTALAVILHDEYVYDYWFFDGTDEELILSSADPHMGFRQKNIGGRDFLIVYEQVIGHAYPADIAAIIDEKPKVLSAIDSETEYTGLFYSPFGEIVCMRGEGVSIGAHNVIPYYWNDEAVDFVPYAVKEIGLEELKALDPLNAVEDINNISSAYQRDNGLVHVNYNVPDDTSLNDLITTSRTYVRTEMGLRKYDFDNDAEYGFFLECLPIIE